MINYTNNSDTLIIILHEIYGINKHIEKTCDYYNLKGYDVICPNLLKENQVFNYNQEEEAYKNFMENISFESTSLVVENLIVKYRKEYKYIFLVGYSVGATIGWLCSDKSDIINGVIGYYGSRIRDYLYVRTKCPVLLFFSNKEVSIDVGKIISSTDKIKINTYLINGDHGFGDPFIKNYCALLDKRQRY